jgi:type II secretory pathway pseudopilin PulG
MRGRKNKPGFTLIETLVSILIITTGILSLAAVYAQGLAVNSKTQFDYIAQAKAEEALETIFAARDSGQITWAQIQNTCSSTTGTTGIFLCGPQPLLAPGPDGLYGTADDDATNPNVIIAGPNSSGVLGTTAGTPAPGDVVIPLTFMTREIQIASLVTDGSLRQVTIIMRYTVAGSPRTYTLVSCISQPS